MLGLFLTLLLPGCLSLGVPGDETGSIQRRNLIQFSNVIKCVQPGSKPLRTFNNYGCYCGFGGSGKPVDDLDRCCQTHDNCYGRAKKELGCKFHKNPKAVFYKYSCSNKTVTCRAENGRCAQFVCECDRKAAICFSKAKYNPKNKGLKKSSCK
ncbi:phospholipase A2-like [Rhinoraja longicauda]